MDNNTKLAKLIVESVGSEVMGHFTPVSGKGLSTEIIDYGFGKDTWFLKAKITWYGNFGLVDWVGNFFTSGDKKARSTFEVTGILETKKDQLDQSKFRITEENENARAVKVLRRIPQIISFALTIPSDY